MKKKCSTHYILESIFQTFLMSSENKKDLRSQVIHSSLFYSFTSNCASIIVTRAHFQQLFWSDAKKLVSSGSRISAACFPVKVKRIRCYDQANRRSWAGQASLRSVTSSGMVASNRKVGDQRESPRSPETIHVSLFIFFLRLFFLPTVLHPATRVGTLA